MVREAEWLGRVSGEGGRVVREAEWLGRQSG